MMIFPLSPIGKVVLIAIAVVLGLIWWAMTFPDSFKKIFGKKKSKK